MDMRGEPTDAAPMKLGDAIKRAYKGRHTQTSLAVALGVEQGTVSKWATGANTPSFDQLRAIEDACGRRRGYVLRLAGYVDDPKSTEDAIANDPSLSDDGAAIVLSAYRAAVERSRMSPA